MCVLQRLAPVQKFSQATEAIRICQEIEKLKKFMNLPEHVLIIIGCWTFHIDANWLLLTGLCYQGFSFARFLSARDQWKFSRASLPSVTFCSLCRLLINNSFSVRVALLRFYSRTFVLEVNENADMRTAFVSLADRSVKNGSQKIAQKKRREF